MSIREEQIVQQWFINSDVLPKSVTVNFSHIELDELAKKWGMKPKEEVQRDFRYCVLPKGWSKVAHNNSWWVSVLDDRKRPRALIFAAVREEMIPNLIVQRRFDVAIELDHKGVDSVENRARFVVTDCGKTVATGNGSSSRADATGSTPKRCSLTGKHNSRSPTPTGATRSHTGDYVKQGKWLPKTEIFGEQNFRS